MRETSPLLPEKIDADVACAIVKSLFDSVEQNNVSYKYIFKGVSERTALGDSLSINIKTKQNGTHGIAFSFNRDSLYHILPEFLFHPLDRYLGPDVDNEEFVRRHKEQEEQEENAILYFSQFDEQYQKLRISFQEWLNTYVFNGNSFIADYLTADCHFNRQNPYIRAVYPCIPWLRDYRGSEDMIKTALKYAFEGNAVVKRIWKDEDMPLSGSVHYSIDGSMDDLFCGATFKTGGYLWHVKYQTVIKSASDLASLKVLISEFSSFFQDWFLSVEESLLVEFGDWTAAPDLSSEQTETGVFLNYSTQLK